MVNIEFNSINQLVDHCANELRLGMYQDKYFHLIMYYTIPLRKLLESENNKPSIHDLNIVNSILAGYTGEWKFDRILELYKNRKN